MRNKSGFTLLEMLVVLTGISVLSVFMIPKVINLSQYDFIYNYYRNQSDALSKGEEIIYSFDQYPYQINFNQLGNVSKADSVLINRKQIIVELGSGRLVLK